MKERDQGVTFLGKDTEFEGTLSFHGAIRIDGHFKGEITADGSLTVGEEAMIEANIHVSYIVISGEVHGNILADQRVDIRAPGKVFANIQAPTVVIDEGVIFEGKTRMYQAKEAEEAEEKNLAVIGANEYTGGPPKNLTAIYGIVTNQETGKPIKNARVKSRGTGKKNTETNASGYYELINLKDGKWKLKIKAKDYKKRNAKIAIAGEGAHRQNFELKPKKKKQL